VIHLLRQSGLSRVLDIGCGNGAFTAHLSMRGFSVSGCDSSVSGITVARQAYPHLTFFQHDVMEPLPDAHVGQYDAVVALEVIEHLFLPRRLLSHALLALRPGGTLILSTPYHGYFKNLALAIMNKFDDHWHPLRDFGHIKFFSKRSLTQLLRESGFHVETISTLGRIPVLRCSMLVAARAR
jgi:2-polyprenyl-3-methyl-5-hydroxy-6-metoxy-1,4-benzoquinol methylase